MIRAIRSLATLLFAATGFGQTIDTFLTPADSLNAARRNGVIISEAAIAAGAYLALNQLWYNDYEKSDFHIIDDSNEWLQVDKAGHAFSAYHLSRTSTDLFK
ncbi:MAG: DUF2279 domain-containing protein, partial [Chitinophagaceae bacterium]